MLCRFDGSSRPNRLFVLQEIDYDEGNADFEVRDLKGEAIRGEVRVPLSDELIGPSPAFFAEVPVAGHVIVEGVEVAVG